MIQTLDTTFSQAELDSILKATHGNPFAFLGPHKISDDQWVIRILAPEVEKVEVLFKGALTSNNRGSQQDFDSNYQTLLASKVHSEGFFELVVPKEFLENSLVREDTALLNEITSSLNVVSKKGSKTIRPPATIKRNKKAEAVEVAELANTTGASQAAENQALAHHKHTRVVETQYSFPALSYLLKLTTLDGREIITEDPYAFGPILGELDLHLFAEGNHWKLYEKLGAHLCQVDGVSGVSFVVWAPNAKRVSVVGDFNRWDGRVHPMRKLVGSGVWEIFIPKLGEGSHYKFEVLDAKGNIVLKSDPFAFYGQHSKQTASMVFDLKRYQWADEAWMKHRRAIEWQKAPVSIYEVHLASWQRIIEEDNRSLSYRELADKLLPYVINMGFTHIELMPVSEHPFDGSWGYQVTGYFAPTSRFGNPDEFRYFIDRCHQAGIGVILDWVPGHFPKDVHGLAEFDGTRLYEHADPRQGEHRDWGTLIFNYGRNEVRNFLISNGLFWLDQFHIDGLRVDAVASMLYLDYSREPGEWVPNVHGGRENLDAVYFLKRFNEVAYSEYPGIMTIAEESTSWAGVSRPTYLGGLGFGFKWNMGWMNDSLHYMALDPIHRRFYQNNITFSLVYAFNEHFVLVLSHDEVVHGKRSLLNKMPGDQWQKFANLRMLYAWMWAHPGKKLLFQGGEFGQSQEWGYARSLDWHLLNDPMHSGVSKLIQHLNYLYKTEPAFWEIDTSYAGFEWIDFTDAENSVISFARKSINGDIVIFVVNATPIVREGYRVGALGSGFYKEILNSDSEIYGGSNVGNCGGVWAESIPCHERDYSLTLRLPPLGVIGLKRQKASG